MSKFTLKSLILTSITSIALLTNHAIASESSANTTITTQHSNILYVNINTDDIETLADLLEGVGTKKAQAIIDYRETNGPFTNAEELLNIKGIGPKILEKNLEAIKLDLPS